MFYENLKRICDEKGVKITPIVAECGGAKGSISNWKKGASPNSDIVARLSVRLNVSADMLIFGREKYPLPELTEEEYKCLEAFNDLYGDDQTLAIGFMKGLAAKYDHEAEAKENVS